MKNLRKLIFLLLAIALAASVFCLAPWTSLGENITFYAVWEEIPADEQK